MSLLAAVKNYQNEPCRFDYLLTSFHFKNIKVYGNCFWLMRTVALLFLKDIFEELEVYVTLLVFLFTCFCHLLSIGIVGKIVPFCRVDFAAQCIFDIRVKLCKLV